MQGRVEGSPIPTRRKGGSVSEAMRDEYRNGAEATLKVKESEE